MAVYETKTSTADFKKRFEGNKDITPEMQKTIEDRMKKMFEKTFILNFDTQASIYKEEEKLEDPTAQGGGGFRMMSNMLGGGGTLYKNIKQKSYSSDKEFMGKEFLVVDTLTTYKWKMESETRVIGGYTCYKATAKAKPSKSDFKSMRPKKEDDKPKTDDKKTSFLDSTANPSGGKNCYKISYISTCGTESLLSDEFCPIYLQSQGAYASWTDYVKFLLGISSYYLEKLDDSKTVLTTITDRKSTRLNSSHSRRSRMPSSA